MSSGSQIFFNSPPLSLLSSLFILTPCYCPRPPDKNFFKFTFTWIIPEYFYSWEGSPVIILWKPALCRWGNYICRHAGGCLRVEEPRTVVRLQVCSELAFSGHRTLPYNILFCLFLFFIYFKVLEKIYLLSLL